MKRTSAVDFDLFQLERMASDPAAMETLVLEHAEAVLDALKFDRSAAATPADLRTMLTSELRRMRAAATQDTVPKSFDEVEQAKPGPMTGEEYANVLAGGTRKWRPR